MKKTALPRMVDDPPTVLLWSIDEIAPLIISLVTGMMMGRALIFLLEDLLLPAATVNISIEIRTAFSVTGSTGTASILRSQELL